MHELPEVHFIAGDPPECLVDARPVEPHALVRVGKRTVFVIDLVRMWWRAPGRSRSEIDAALDYIAYYVDQMR
jgi:hypothetical protein